MIAGPDLELGTDEVEVVRSTMVDPVVLTGDRASVDAALGALDGARIAHVVAHGNLHPENPLLTGIRLAGGEVNVYELQGLRSPPAIIILSACHVGIPADRPGHELLGVSTGLLASGSSTVVASTLPVPDTASTVELMGSFHEHLAAPADPGDAWASVQRDETVAPLDAAAFTVFGRG